MAKTNQKETDRILREAEVEGEIVAAFFRIVIFVALISIILSMREHGGHFPQLIAATSIYGLVSFSGLFLALRKIFHPVLPYIYVTLDIFILVTELVLLGKEMELPPALTFALPVASVVFVLMAHAAMRYRPWLVVYTAVLFILGLQMGVYLASKVGDYPSRADLMSEHFGLGGFMHYEAFPIILVGLCAALLFTTTKRTRSLLISSIHFGHRSSRLSRYFSPSIAEELASETGDAALTGKRQYVSVIFVDIRCFSALAEEMTPLALSQFLSEFRHRMVEPVFKEGGTVDKFIGDALMVVFGTPKPQTNDAERTFRCALAMMNTIEEWSFERKEKGHQPISIGIGIHYGEVFAGNIGDDQLLEYTVIGDTVNIAERLEKLTRKLEATMVVSEAFYQQAGEAVKPYQWKYLQAQELSGHRQSLNVYCFDSSPTGSMRRFGGANSNPEEPFWMKRTGGR